MELKSFSSLKGFHLRECPLDKTISAKDVTLIKNKWQSTHFI